MRVGLRVVLASTDGTSVLGYLLYSMALGTSTTPGNAYLKVWRLQVPVLLYMYCGTAAAVQLYLGTSVLVPVAMYY